MAQPILTPLTRGFSSSPGALAAVPAVARSGGFLSSLLGGGSSRVSTPTTEPLPGVSETAPITPPAQAPSTQTTTLPNGLVISSFPSWGPTASLGMYVKCGSVYESVESAGCSHLLEAMAFKATLNRTHFRVVREIEAMGAVPSAQASREQLSYAINVPKTNVPAALELLVDCVVNPALKPWEMADACDSLAAQIKDLGTANPTAMLAENVVTAAYQGGLASPLLMGERPATAGIVHGFAAAALTGPRVVLAGAGVDHAQLVALASPMLAELPGGEGAPPVASHYTGGDFRLPAAGPLTHSILAFESPGWSDLKASVTHTVLQFLLGGGGSFSAGGPGKGMHSRLYTRVLNKHGFMQQCSAFSSLFDNTGLVGISSSSTPEAAGDMVAIMCEELEALTSPASDVEVARAKNAARATVMMALENCDVMCEDIGRQHLTQGKYVAPAEPLRMIDELTPKDIADAVSAMLKTPPTLASCGNVKGLPAYDAVKARFG